MSTLIYTPVFSLRGHTEFFDLTLNRRESFRSRVIVEEL
jgi:hypothetical protein